MTQIMPAAPAPAAAPAKASTTASTDGATIDDFVAVLAEALGALVDEEAAAQSTTDDAVAADAEASEEAAVDATLAGLVGVVGEVELTDLPTEEAALTLAVDLADPSGAAPTIAGSAPTGLEGADSVDPVDAAAVADVAVADVAVADGAVADGVEAASANEPIEAQSGTPEAPAEPLLDSTIATGASGETAEVAFDTDLAAAASADPTTDTIDVTTAPAVAEEVRPITGPSATGPSGVDAVAAASVSTGPATAATGEAAGVTPPGMTDTGLGDPALADDDPWQQLANVVRPLRQMADGSHRISLQLRPAELGTVHLEVAVEDGQLSLRAVTENLMTRDVLSGAMNDLRDELVRSGIDVGSLDVGDHTSDGAGGDPARSDSTAADFAHRPGSNPSAVTGPSVPTDSAPTTAALPGRLDLSL